MDGVELGTFFNGGDGWAQPWVLDVELVESLRFGPPTGHTDLNVAVMLTRLLYGDFVSYGTDKKGMHLDDESVPVVIKAHRAVLGVLPRSRRRGRSVRSTGRVGSAPTGVITACGTAGRPGGTGAHRC
ncbi:hypothetical protein GCM10018775_92770 [Streptomyces umbrinus]|nr:hypothetical protein GCM10018775_92770 [Streptomyces umbrinus]